MIVDWNREARCKALLRIINKTRDSFQLPDPGQAGALEELINNQIHNSENHLSVDEKKNCSIILSIIMNENLYRNERLIIFLVCELAKYHQNAEFKTLFTIAVGIVAKHKGREIPVVYQLDNLVSDVRALQNNLDAFGPQKPKASTRYVI